MPAQTFADFRVRDRLGALDLAQAFLDFAYEPIVVSNETLDRLTISCSGSMRRFCARRARLAYNSGDNGTSIG